MGKQTFQLAKPLADRVLIEKEEVQTKTTGGIIIPETARAEDIKVGDKVMMPFAGTAQIVKIENKEYYLFREQELLMIIK